MSAEFRKSANLASDFRKSGSLGDSRKLGSAPLSRKVATREEFLDFFNEDDSAVMEKRILTVVNFGVFRRNKKTNDLEDRVMQLDFTSECIALAKDGVIENTYFFSRIYKVLHDPITPALFTIYLTDIAPLELNAQTTDETRTIIQALERIIAKENIKDEMVSEYQKATIKSGFCKEKVSLMNWADRWMVIKMWSILFFKNKENDLPLQIFLLKGSDIIPKGKTEIQLVSNYREIKIKFDAEDDRNSWLSAFKEAMTP